MLLRHTQKEITPRSSLAVNPAKTCQPVGAMYAALGMNRCLPHSHGSQGCCAYHRSTLTRHYKEPVMAATSSFTEGSSVFGGQSNLLQSIDNIFSIYDPDVIAIHTTCLSETIGDDMVQIIAKASDDGKIPKGKTVIHTNTPSYIGSHVTGFSNMVRNMVEYFAQPEENKIRTLNIIPGWVEPADMSEIKRICGMMKIETLMFPDTSGTLAAPLYRTKKMYPDGGVTVEQLKRVGMSSATIALGAFASLPAAERLDEKAEVPYHALDLPIGLTATDKFIDTLRKVAGVEVPPEVMYERGRLVDLICDTHQYLHNKRVALWGDPDQLVALSQFLLDLDMQPVYAVTGTPGQLFERHENRTG